MDLPYPFQICIVFSLTAAENLRNITFDVAKESNLVCWPKKIYSYPDVFLLLIQKIMVKNEINNNSDNNNNNNDDDHNNNNNDNNNNDNNSKLV